MRSISTLLASALLTPQFVAGALAAPDGQKAARVCALLDPQVGASLANLRELLDAQHEANQAALSSRLQACTPVQPTLDLREQLQARHADNVLALTARMANHPEIGLNA